MSPYDFVQLAFLELGGEIRGKTMLQKTIYFLGVFADCVEDLGYRPHYYGPYSAEVAGAVDSLRALGFVDQSVASGGAYDRQGFEVARYDFRLNEQGRQIAEVKARQNGELARKMKKAVEVFKKGADLDYVKLSIAAKTYFMLGQAKKEKTSIGDLVALAKKFGWTVTDGQIREAAQFLKSVGLVQL